MKVRWLSFVAVCATNVAGAQTWRTLEVSRQLRDSAAHQVRVHYDAGRFTLAPTAEPVLFSMQLRYNEDHVQPLHEYDALERRVELGVQGESDSWSRYRRDRSQAEMRLALSSAVPMDLSLELGAAEARVNAGGLALRNLSIETGAADAILDFSEPNRSQMGHLDLKLGAASFVITHLGNANVSDIHVEGGVGSVDLDFGGAIQRDVSVDASVALGKLTLHLPDSVGVRVNVRRVLASFDHPGLHKRGDAYYSDNWDTARVRIRVSAETVFGAVEIDRDR